MNNMKTVYTTTMMILALLMLVLPLTAGQIAPAKGDSIPVMGNGGSLQLPDESVKLYSSAEKNTVEYALSDYLFGVVAAEMPALYEEEALKAQTVAAYTFFLKRKEANADKEYDITDDYNLDQAFISPDKAKEKWGSGAEEYTNKIASAVKSVLYKKVTYNGVPASTVYHAISFGKTENAAEVWGGEYPYLVSVDSSFDKLAENYLSETSFKAEELKTALSSVAEVKSLTENCITDLKRTSAGGVKSLSVSGAALTGGQLRKALELRSTDFDVAFKNGVYTFTVRGYGHSIGMSQHGANYMAMQGKSYEEILLHYYPGCKIE